MLPISRLSYRQLPELLFETVAPTPVQAPTFLLWNDALAAQLQLVKPADATLFSGNQLASWMQPTALAYSGHQFGQLSPRLGDGRAILLAELQDVDGNWFDLQLKGSGPTPYSRRGDGRAALGPVLREYLVSEWMAAAGVPTSRALAAVASGEPVYREQALPGAIFTRIASSHLRIGTVQFAAMFGSTDQLRQLADYCIQRHYPTAQQSANPYLALLQAVSQAQASLVARWMSLGFVHGVMNTDNMSISGETIDYGPCAFIDQFSYNARFSSIDEGGRYAYRNQPAIAQWNLARLAEALLPLIDKTESVAIEQAMTVLNAFPAAYQQAWRGCFAAKLGLLAPTADDDALIEDLLQQMAAAQLDFTDTFYQLADWLTGLSACPAVLSDWLTRWQQRLHTQAAGERTSELLAARRRMQQVNPAFIPRNYLIEQILSAAHAGDLAPAQQFLAALSDLYTLHPWFSQLPPQGFTHYRTFCGT